MKKSSSTIRRAIQGFVLIFFIYIIWSTKYPLKGFINPGILFKLDPLVMIITAIAERILLAGLIFALITLAISFVFGRVFCGWFCPLGTTFDLWAWLTKILRKKGENEPGGSKNIKYFLLGLLFILSLLGIQTIWLFDPITIFVRTFSFNIHPLTNRILDGILVFFIKILNYPVWLETFYYKLKESVLQISNPVFPHAVYIFAVFAILLILIFFKRRFWCRYLCPLGAMLALPARFSPLRRMILEKNIPGSCKNVCRMNAIRGDNSYIPEECILCMDCVDYCPRPKAAFSFFEVNIDKNTPKTSNNTMTRSQFIKWLSGSLIVAASGSKSSGGSVKSTVIRPPAALREDKFVRRCVRCGNCMKVCPTNVLQPALLESGCGGVWTPKFDTNIGYCEYKCVLCGQVCPTEAIRELSVDEKQKTKMGLAVIDRSICLPWAKGTECIVCQEHCPVAEKAIKLSDKRMPDGKILKQPRIDADLCVGCAICENKCPVDPVRAVKVQPF